MRVGELSRKSGVPLPTIKYYLREGLLPPGTATAPNQAAYGAEHLRRLRLIRALIDVGKLSIAAARSVIEAVDNPDLAPHELLGTAHTAISPARAARPDEEWATNRETATRMVRELGWQVHESSPALDQLADVITAAKRLDFAEVLGGFEVYAAAAATIAENDLALVADRADAAAAGGARGSMVETVVLGTLLGEVLLLALRRLAQQDASARRFGHAPDPPPEQSPAA